MIIDSHVHVGKSLSFNMPEEMLIKAMDKAGVDFSIAMNVESVEVGHNQEMISESEQVSQLDSARHLVETVKRYPTRIGAAIWLRPLTETLTDEMVTFIKENRDYIYAIKFHPYHSKVAFNDVCMTAYFELARELNLPVVTHTAGDCDSAPMHVYDVAKKYPDVKFVMVHLGLGTDNEEAIELIAKLDNLYGDSTWVTPDKVLKAIEVCGAHKIMFGTDAPINGEDTYDDEMFYNFCFNEMKNHISKEAYDAFMYKTAIEVFNLKQFK